MDEVWRPFTIGDEAPARRYRPCACNCVLISTGFGCYRERVLRLVTALAALAFGAGIAGGCDAGVATQTLVRVAVDPALGGAELRVRVWDQDGTLVYDETRPDGGDFGSVLPARIPLEPKDGDAGRRFRVEAELRDADGVPIRVQRAEAGYVAGERREIWLCIDSRCDASSCADSERCDEGSCGPIAAETEPAGASSEASACGFGAPTDAAMDAVADASSDADAGPPCECPCASDTCVDGVCSPVSEVIDVSAGDSHVCAIDGEGRLFCWGENSDGQLADTDRSARPAPTVPVALGPARQVSAGRRHTCALLLDGTLHCWGWGNLGQISEGRESSDVPLPQVPPDTTTHPANGWSQVSAGGTVTCAVHGATLFCWGSNREGQLGIGADPGALDGSPNEVSGTWRQVSAGDRHVCGLRDDVDGSVACWGQYDNQRLGLLDDPMMDVTSPRNVRGLGVRDYVSVELGYEHTCAIQTTRELRCWGRGAGGRLGIGNMSDTGNSGPVIPEPPAPSFRWGSASAGAAHTCGLAEDGALWCWGENRAGELGLGDGVGAQVYPRRVGDDAWRAVAAGQDLTCAIDGDGRAHCWGANDSGQLGIGDFISRSASAEPVCLPPL
jgi:hypothetical protein